MAGGLSSSTFRDCKKWPEYKLSQPKEAGMQERHLDRKIYFNEQFITTTKYVIPYLEEYFSAGKHRRVMEIGCGEGGNLLPFLDAGCDVTGIDLSAGKIDKARIYFSEHPNRGNLKLICDDVYQLDDTAGRFDLIFLRDVIEHIYDQGKFLHFVLRFLKPGGVIFFAFPPWQNPFGGHQQICRNRLLSHMPWVHLLPRSIYTAILQFGGETQATINALLEIRDTRLTIERFETLLQQQRYRILRKSYYLINPNYEVKFGLKPRLVPAFLGKIPWLRNFVTTTAYYLIDLPTT